MTQNKENRWFEYMKWVELRRSFFSIAADRILREEVKENGPLEEKMVTHVLRRVKEILKTRINRKDEEEIARAWEAGFINTPLPPLDGLIADLEEAPSTFVWPQSMFGATSKREAIYRAWRKIVPGSAAADSPRRRTDSGMQIGAQHELKNGDSIPGSRFYRWYCERCGTPMRVTMRKTAATRNGRQTRVPARRECEDCDPRHFSPGNSVPFSIDQDPDAFGRAEL